MRCRWQSQREVVTVAGLLRQVQCYYRELKQIWLWYRHKIKPAPHRVQYVDYFFCEDLSYYESIRPAESEWTHFFTLIFCLSEKLMISCSGQKFFRIQISQFFKKNSFQIAAFPDMLARAVFLVYFFQDRFRCLFQHFLTFFEHLYSLSLNFYRKHKSRLV